jgi:predicted RNase H-like nuclease
MRGADMRMAEYLLRARSIVISPTPAQKENCPEWMQLSFNLYDRLDQAGFKPFPSDKAPLQWLETHPHAAFCALLGQQPLSKPTLEGRIQRQLVLHEANVGIRNPMEFFEEITRHRLIKGIFPIDLIYAPEQLDALVAAYTAFLAAREPEKISFIGTMDEGRIVLPVSDLKVNY